MAKNHRAYLAIPAKYTVYWHCFYHVSRVLGVNSIVYLGNASDQHDSHQTGG